MNKKIIYFFLFMIIFNTAFSGEMKTISLECTQVAGFTCRPVQGSEFIKINNAPIAFYSTAISSPDYDISHGNFDSRLLLVGNNLFQYSIAYGATIGQYMKHLYNVKLLPDLFLVSFTHEGISPAITGGQFFKNIGLEKIDPALAKKVLAEREKFYATNNEYNQYTEAAAGNQSGQITDLKKEIEISQANYARCLEMITQTEWNNIDSDSLSLCHEAKDILAQLKKELAKSNVLLEGQKESIQKALDNRADQIGGIVKKFDVPTTEDIPDDLSVKNQNELAEAVISELERSYNNQDRENFINIAKNWIQNARNITANASLDIRTLTQIKTINQKVDNFIFSKVDQNFWFKDIQIKEEIKNIISEDIARVNPDAANKLKAEINKWGRPLTELEKSQLQALEGIGEFIKKSFLLANGVFNIPKKLNNAINEMALDIGKGAACIAGNTLLNDWGDAFELFTGRDRCNYEIKKTTFERACSGLGLVIGSGTAWKKVFGESDVYNDLQVVASKVDNLHLKDADEVSAFGKVLKTGPRKTSQELKIAVNSVSELEYFGPFKAGPLHLVKAGNQLVADTFRGGQYFKTKLGEPITLYRAYGKRKTDGTLNVIGSYWTRTKPLGPFQATIDSALYPEWATIVGWAEMTIPAGTEFFEGAVAPQLLKSKTGNHLGELIGGGNQIYISKIGKWKIVENLF